MFINDIEVWGGMSSSIFDLRLISGKISRGEYLWMTVLHPCRHRLNSCGDDIMDSSPNSSIGMLDKIRVLFEINYPKCKDGVSIQMCGVHVIMEE